MSATAHFDLREYGEQTIGLGSALRSDFERVWPALAKAIASYGPTHSKRDVWKLLQTDMARLWTKDDSAIVTTIERWPSGLRECQFWAAGGELDAVLALRPEIEAWAAERGCDRSLIVGRRGWGRLLPDYHVASTAFTKDLHP